MEYIKGYIWHKNNCLSPPLSDTRYDFDKLVKKGNNSFKNGLIKLQQQSSYGNKQTCKFLRNPHLTMLHVEMDRETDTGRKQ